MFTIKELKTLGIKALQAAFKKHNELGDSGLESGETQLIVSGGNAGKMLIP